VSIVLGKKKSGDDLLSRSTHRNSTISAGGLNCSVRKGKRCNPAAIVTRNLCECYFINVEVELSAMLVA
jgi:hypothetical protein